MARIIGGLGSSHTPTIGFAHDANKQTDPVWAPIFDAFKDMKNWLEEKQPDVVFIIYNDHITSFFFDHYSPFSLGFDEEFSCADEGGGIYVSDGGKLFIDGAEIAADSPGRVVVQEFRPCLLR